MPTELYMVTIDAANPQRLARFWGELLGYKVTFEDDDEVAIERPDERRPALWFTKVPDSKAGKNRVHLDLNPDDQAAEVERALRLGATRIDIGQRADPDTTWEVLADPEGNEFCILTPR